MAGRARKRVSVSGCSRLRTNPCTHEQDYTAEELTFLKAIDRYQRVNDRAFPTYCEVLAILFSLGYRKVAAPCGPPTFRRAAGPGRKSR